jgi:hypothetical protein
MSSLKDRIAATLDANADTRRQAEIDLRYVRCVNPTVVVSSLIFHQAEDQPGFPDALLNILEIEQDSVIRQASTYFYYVFVIYYVLTTSYSRSVP